ncbi:MAG: 50S ribosomal protein L3 [Candidatus Kerfeldbacteria bacterium]|nr:50S ribosomal protein L3 [Candidatus Kerfeldbacteria bacterium]
MKFLLGTKGAMTTHFTPDGAATPVTEVHAGPCVVTQVKTAAHDGANAVQVGFGAVRKLRKPEAGHLHDLPTLRTLREFRTTDPAVFQRGQELRVTQFAPGDEVRVSGTSKGRGFQGVVKRHGFHGSPASHGHKDQLRRSGSVGSTGSQRVFKGTRMAGRMGGERVSVRNLEVVGVDAERNILLIKGAVPGHRGTLLEILGAGDTPVPVETKA